MVAPVYDWIHPQVARENGISPKLGKSVLLLLFPLRFAESTSFTADSGGVRQWQQLVPIGVSALQSRRKKTSGGGKFDIKSWLFSFVHFLLNPRDATLEWKKKRRPRLAISLLDQFPILPQLIYPSFHLSPLNPFDKVCFSFFYFRLHANHYIVSSVFRIWAKQTWKTTAFSYYTPICQKHILL